MNVYSINSDNELYCITEFDNRLPGSRRAECTDLNRYDSGMDTSRPAVTAAQKIQFRYAAILACRDMGAETAYV